MSDVGAVVLTLGEETTNRALASVRAQTAAIREVIVIDGMRPFHKALNAGADIVTTPLFLQVDADMVLDVECADVLRGAITPEVGIAVGALRDPLMGTIAGVKMFRRECFSALRMRDTVAPDVDYITALEQLGWSARWVIGDMRRRRTHTLGQHRPCYTADYVFGTYYLLGARYAYRDPGAMLWRFARLRRSSHTMAPIARLAMGHGLFSGETRDVAKPAPLPATAQFLHRLALSTEDDSFPAGRVRALMTLATEPLFAAFQELGASLRVRSCAALRGCLRALSQTDHPHSFIAEAALAQGALAGAQPATSRASIAVLERTLLAALHPITQVGAAPQI